MINDPMKTNDFEPVRKKHLSFWRREVTDRPLIGFTIGAGLDSWSYWQDNKAARALLGKERIEPQDIEPESFVEDQRRYLELSAQVGDDICRTAMPLASIPWMEAILGCPVVSTGAHLASSPLGEDPDAAARAPFNPENSWSGSIWNSSASTAGNSDRAIRSHNPSCAAPPIWRVPCWARRGPP